MIHVGWLDCQTRSEDRAVRNALESIVLVPFNPTAENMAMHLLLVVGPQVLVETGVNLCRVTVEETRKCSAVDSR